jgi:hypothetical protein
VAGEGARAHATGEADDYASQARAAITRDHRRASRDDDKEPRARVSRGGAEAGRRPPVERAPLAAARPQADEDEDEDEDDYASRRRADDDDDDYRPSRRGWRDWRRPGVYYDPYVTVTEEFYVNGRLVRRSYRRPARPSDFYGYR